MYRKDLQNDRYIELRHIQWTFINSNIRIFSNYWMTLSRIWRILQVEESVIHRGLQPRWITPSEICRILHILRKPNAINKLLYYSFKIIFSLKLVKSTRGHFSLCWMTQPCAQVFLVNVSIIFDVNDSIICSGLYFWRHFDINGSIICSGLHFWRHWFNMTEFLVNSSCLWWITRVVLTN